jgi:leader peptidase (prepilin peptidase)/N-methyltransferase
LKKSQQLIASDNFGTICFIGFVGVSAVTASLLIAPGPRGMVGAVLAVIITAIAVYDARYLIIPNLLTAAAFILALVYTGISVSYAGFVQASIETILRAAIAALVFLAIKIAYEKLRGHPGIGMGDVKLMGVAGAWLDWLTIVCIVEIAALAALAAYMARQHFKSRPVRTTGVMPFGLFLAPSIWLGWLLEAYLHR